jgi:hypothetical protein
MDAYTRHLHWMRSADDCRSSTEMTCAGVNPTIQTYPGHIDPARVTTDCLVRADDEKHGLRVKQVRGGNQTAVDASRRPGGTMGQLGVTHYWRNRQPRSDKANHPQPTRSNEGRGPWPAGHGTTLLYTRAGANAGIGRVDCW